MGALWHSDSKKTVVPADGPDDAPLPKRPRRKRYGWRLFWLLSLIGLAALGLAISAETRSSKLQAREFSRFAATLSYSMQPGPSNSIM